MKKSIGIGTVIIALVIILIKETAQDTIKENFIENIFALDAKKRELISSNQYDKSKPNFDTLSKEIKIGNYKYGISYTKQYLLIKDIKYTKTIRRKICDKEMEKVTKQNGLEIYTGLITICRGGNMYVGVKRKIDGKRI